MENLEGDICDRYSSMEGIRVKRSKSGASMKSQRSVIDPRHSLHSNNTGYRTSMDGVPVEHMPSPINPRSTDSDSSIESCPTPLNDPAGFVQSGILHDPFGAGNASKSQVEIERPPSPRTQMEAFRSENPGISAPAHAAPMDRFLAQEDGSTDFGDDPVRLEEEWKRLRTLRSNALRLRGQLKVQRKELHEKQSVKTSRDEAFMKYVRELRLALPALTSSMSSKSAESTLDAHFNSLQAARDDYGPAEDDYNLLENVLDETEFELAMVEGRLYNTRKERVPSIPGLDLNPSTPDEPPPATPISLMGLASQEAFKTYHPFQEEYLSRLGDLDLATERYQNLTHEKEKLVWERESRARFGIELQEHENDFLREYPARQAALQLEIAEIEEDVEQWKEKCIAEGLDISEGANRSEQESVQGASISHVEQANIQGDIQETISVIEKNIEQESAVIDSDEASPISVDDKNIPDENPTLQFGPQPQIGPFPVSSKTKFPIILPQSAVGKADLDRLISDFNEKDKGDRIKLWMLDKLRTSPLEVELLVRVFLQVKRILDIREWQKDMSEWEFRVLFYWERDEANKVAEAFNGPRTIQSTSDATPTKPMVRRPRLYSQYAESTKTLEKVPSIAKEDRRAKSASGLFDFTRRLKASEILRTFRS